MKGKLILSFSLLISILFLSGCGESVEEKIFNKLEKTVELEESNEASEKMNELEIKDKELLNEIAGLTDKELPEINKKSEAAIEINEELKDTIEEEKSIYDDAQKEFEKSESLIKKIEEETNKETGLEMYDVMMKRYATYDELVEEYQLAIDERIKFYELIKDKDAKEEKVLDQVEQVNKHNEQIIKLNTTFNKSVEKYNELKKDLYKKMNIKVEYKE